MRKKAPKKPVYTFTPDGRELVINNPRLRRPWFNYLSGENYGLKFSQTGGGFSVFPILEGRQITRYGADDQGGRYVYLRDNASKETWSLNWQPVQKDLDKYECRHGLGYSVINSEYRGIAHSLRVFALQDIPAEMWTISISNKCARKRDISFFPFVEWYLGAGLAMWDAPIWYTRTAYSTSKDLMTASFYDPKNVGQCYSVFMKPFFKIDGYCCSKRAFCGFTGSLQTPEMLASADFKYGLAHGEDTIGCLKRDLALKPGERREFHLLIGYQENEKARDKVIAMYSEQAKRAEAFTQIHDFWETIVKKHEISTPDTDFNRWINVWLKYQDYQCFRWAGLGEPNAPLMGYRDVLQHVLAMSLFAPEMAKARLIEALGHQYKNGRAVRQWSRRGNHDRRDYRDSPVWIIFALCSYLKETHDFTILEHVVPYLDNAGEGSVLAHAVNAVNALYNDRGAHGLSHIGEGDWYDPLNKIGIKGRGESVWLSMALVAALKEMSSLFKYMRRHDDAASCDRRAKEVANCVNAHGWDGAWYLNAFDDEGGKIGSHECDEGKIFANPQTWAIISGLATEERRNKCIASVEKHLKNIYGYPAETPHYTFKNRHYGNVGILQANSRAYSHVSAFKMVSDCLCGRGDDAYATFKRIDPTSPVHPPETTMADPHIIPNGYTGTDSNMDEAFVLHSGSSGAFPWILKAAVEYMLGARAEYEGLRICPCLPGAWKTASIRREFRGAVYNIRIENPGGTTNGIRQITVDGRPIKGTLIKPLDAGKEHSVLCILGGKD